mmetsp:Transcript_26416/g.86841  ORF Transcript_26416/g.86841 Transcript_26416/m.86841 type:complete len:680 (-) Transcript_26416:600-2639(-)
MATGLDDNFVTTDYRQLASYPVRSTGGYGGEDVPLISGQNGAPVTFTQIEHVPTQSIGNHQPSLIHIDGKDVDVPKYEFPGWVPPTELKLETLEAVDKKSLHHPSRGVLGEIYATAIAGNDVTSSVLYIVGVTSTLAGQLSPICMLLAGCVLYLFKAIIGEAGSAIPLNGGAYSLLLNTTTKPMAALAACLTLLSYVATAVVSATECMTYASNLVPELDVYWGTIILLALVCILCILGITECAFLAVGVFIVHIASMCFLIAVAATFMVQNPEIMAANLREPLKYDWPLSLIFGFCVALLGVTGYETSVNYIEEQQKGVFFKTLFNTWLIVFLMNPALSIVCMGVLDLNTIESHHRDVLAKVAYDAGGKYFGLWIAADACTVLLGSLITAFVGMTGVARRLALDRCLPQFLLAENRWRRTNHLIPFTFFVVCTLLFVLLNGSVRSLANVYSLAFLCVMSLYAIGTMILKYKRGSIRRAVKASWPTCFAALAFSAIAILGNVLLAPNHLIWFIIYFGIVSVVMLGMFERVRVLKWFLYALSQSPQSWQDRFAGVTQMAMDKIRSQKVAFFATSENLEILSKAVAYIQSNELTKWIKIVYLYEDLNDPVIKRLAENLRVIDRCYPKMVFDLVLVNQDMSPEVVAQISLRLGIPRNFMFISCPPENVVLDIAEYGGLRIITH